MQQGMGAKILGAVVAVVVAIGVRHAINEWRDDRTKARLPPEWNLPAKDEERLTTALEESKSRMMNHPKVRARLEATVKSATSQADAFRLGQEIGRELTEKGMARLPAADLVEWNRLRLLMSERSDGMCVTFWTGNIDAREMGITLAALSDEDLRTWLRITTDAAILEADGGPPPVVDEAMVTKQFGPMEDALSGNEKERFAKTMSAGVDAPASDGCFVMKIILRHAAGLKEPEREMFLRGLAQM